MTCRRTSKRVRFPEQPRLLGTHRGCGGRIFYSSTATRGWRWCETCGASTNKGDSLEVDGESQA